MKNNKTNKKSNTWIYCIIAICGIFLITLSILLSNSAALSSVLSGLGTGAFSSLIVSLLFNLAADRRIKEEKETNKNIIFHDIMYATKDSYIDLIYRINEYIIFSESDLKCLYEVYNDTSGLKEFWTHLGSINYEVLSDEKKKQINKLFNFGSYRIDRLASEIRHMPKQSYYLQGLLTEKELNNLSSNLFIDKYTEYVSHLKEFWDNEIIDYNKCLTLLRVTLSCCCQVISTFEKCKKDVMNEEVSIKEEMEYIYYNEVYCKSEEYINSQIEQAEAEQAYYDEHPELIEELEEQCEKWENETPTDRAIRDMECLFFGFSAYSFDELLKRADKSDPKLLAFFKRKEIKKTIKKHKFKKIIISNYGKEYYDKIKQASL